MDTVANTPKPNENPPRLTSTKKKLRRHYLREARRMRTSRTVYYSEPDLFEYARENAAVMEGFVSWLDLCSLGVEYIQKACLYYILHANVNAGEKENVARELNHLTTLTAGLSGARQMISEKAFYYAGVVEELDGVKNYRDSKSH